MSPITYYNSLFPQHLQCQVHTVADLEIISFMFFLMPVQSHNLNLLTFASVNHKAKKKIHTTNMYYEIYMNIRLEKKNFCSPKFAWSIHRFSAASNACFKSTQVTTSFHDPHDAIFFSHTSTYFMLQSTKSMSTCKHACMSACIHTHTIFTLTISSGICFSLSNVRVHTHTQYDLDELRQCDTAWKYHVEKDSQNHHIVHKQK